MGFFTCDDKLKESQTASYLTSMDIARFLLFSLLFCSSSITRPWLAEPFPFVDGFPFVFFRRAGLGGSVAAALGDSRP